MFPSSWEWFGALLSVDCCLSACLPVRPSAVRPVFCLSNTRMVHRRGRFPRLPLSDSLERSNLHDTNKCFSFYRFIFDYVDKIDVVLCMFSKFLFYTAKQSLPIGSSDTHNWFIVNGLSSCGIILLQEQNLKRKVSKNKAINKIWCMILQLFQKILVL